MPIAVPATAIQTLALTETRYGHASEHVSCVSAHLHGHLDREHARRAWEHVVRRVPALHGAFVWQPPDRPLSVAISDFAPELVLHDQATDCGTGWERQFEAVVTARLQAGIDPFRPGLVGLDLMPLTDAAWAVALTFHHAALDDRGARRVLELWLAACAGADGKEDADPDELSFGVTADGVDDRASGGATGGMNDRVTAGVTDDTVGHASRRASALPPIPRPAILRPFLAAFATRVPQVSDDGASTPHEQAPSCRQEQLERLASDAGIHPDTLVLAAWAELLLRASGRERVRLGVLIGARGITPDAPIRPIGPFTEVRGCDVHRRAGQTVEAWLRDLDRRREEILSPSYPWRELDDPAAYESVVDLAGASRAGDFIRRPLQLRAFRAHALQGPSLIVHPWQDGRACAVTSRHPGFRESELSCLHNLLDGILANLVSTRLSSDVSSTAPAETRVRPETLTAAFAIHVAKTPEATAISAEDGQLSYHELDRQSTRLAWGLRDRGVVAGSRVALLLDRSKDMAVCVLAVLKAGGVYVPIDPLTPPARIAHVVEDSGAVVLLARTATAPPAAALAVPAILVDRFNVAESADSQQPLPDLDASYPAYVIYTSGSTGQPKGVVVTHGNVLRLFEASRSVFRFDSDDVWTVFHSLAFDFSVWELWGALLHGGRAIILGHWVTRTPEQFYELLERERVTVLSQTPAAFQALLTVVDAAETRRPLALRYVVFGGEALAPRQLKAWWRAYGDRAPLLVNMYGITETTVHVTWRPMLREDEDLDVSPIGAPLDHLSLRLMSPDLEPVAAGAAGEICVGGDGVALGYLDVPHLTAERFVPDPCSTQPGRRMYRSGDLARHVDGETVYLGRSDAQVKIRGHRIEPREIETVLALFPGVTQPVVLAREGVAAGDRYLHAFVVMREPPLESRLRTFVRERLPGYMVPAVFTVLDRLPVTVNGKVDRKRLSEWPMPARHDERRGGMLTAIEEMLAYIWRDLLDVESVGRDDSFVALGGHSLVATLLVSRVRRETQRNTQLRDLFEADTLGKMARVIERDLRTAAGPLPPIMRRPAGGPAPLSHAQRRLWFLNRLVPEDTSYNIVSGLIVTGPLSYRALAGALGDLRARHETLRTRFVETPSGGPVQIVDAASRVSMPIVDLGELDEHAASREIERLALIESSRTFNLATSTLVHALLVRRRDEHHALLVTLHHIIGDGWSMGVALHDTAAFYDARVRGTIADLPPLAISYADFSEWQQQTLTGDRLAALSSHWKARLAGATPLRLGNRAVTRTSATFPGAVARVEVPSELAAATRDLSRRHGATLYMTLASVFAALLRRVTGQRDIVIGCPVAGRDREELEDHVGFFVNTLPLRVRLDGAPAFESLLDDVRQACLDLFAHQEMPFEKIVEEQQSTRELDRQPLFQVVFELLNAPRPELRLGEASLKPLHFDRRTTRFDLELHASDYDGAFDCYFVYNTDLFEREEIERLSASFAMLLAGVTADPARAIEDYPLLMAAEHTALVKGDQAWASHAVSGTLATAFEAMAAMRGSAAAIGAGDAWWSYATLNARANGLAWRLRAAGVGPETRVALQLARGPALFGAMLGVAKAGGAYVPLDPAYPAERQQYQVTDSGARVLVVDGAAPEWAAVAGVTVVAWDDGDERPVGPAVTAPADAAAYVLYTSGSTGRPKGVVVTHANVRRLLDATAAAFAFGPADVWTWFHSAAFDFSVWELWGALLSGGRVVVVDWATSRQPAAFYALVAREQVTVLNQTPTAFAAFAAEDARGRAALAVRVVIFGGEALTAAHVREWVARHGTERPALINMYGITETTVHVTYRPWTAADLAAEAGSRIGQALDDLQVYVLDDGGALLPRGVAGELYVGGAGLARGYVGQPGLTAARFVPDGVSGAAGARLYRTGDRVRWRAVGDLEYLGRLDQQVKIRGHRIELGEIEAVLRAQPGVADAVVVARPGPDTTLRLMAYVTPDAADTFSDRRLDADAAQTSQVTEWREVFDKTYTQGASADPTFDISGWNSAYDGSPLPASDMKEWVDTTVDRLRPLARGRVLEIGCGTGLLLFRLAPHCTSYLATEISPEALRAVARTVRQRPDLGHVRTILRAADDLRDVGGPFDLIVLNSVVQYFPGRAYLERVLTTASALLAPGGRIFVGDVRDHRLLTALHRSVQWRRRAGDQQTIAAFEASVARQIEREEELSLAPAFFSRFVANNGVMRHATVLLKRGRDTELSRYRYDVILDATSHADPAPHAAAILDGLDGDQPLEALDRMLAGGDAPRLLLRGLRNARLSFDRRLDAALSTAFPHATLDDVERAMEAGASGDGIDPEQLASRCQAAGYRIALAPSLSGDDRFDAALCLGGEEPTAPLADEWKETPAEVAANDPMKPRAARLFAAGIRSGLEAALPDYMLPSSITTLDVLPRLPNGKIDRQSLPDPDRGRPDLPRRHRSPATRTEQSLARIWRNLLGIDVVGLDDTFFELGGHSLLATRAVSHVRSELGIELPLWTMYANPTLGEVAAAIDAGAVPVAARPASAAF